VDDLLASQILWAFALVIYAFVFNPLIGCLLGAENSFGQNDKYDDAMGRGLVFHVVVLVIYIVGKALIFKLIN